MPKLTAQQASDMGHQFIDTSLAIIQFRLDNLTALSNKDSQYLGVLYKTLLNAGEDMLAMSTTLVMDEVAASLATIQTVTAEVKQSLKTLTNIQKGISVAACLVNLATAIISKKPQSIGDGIKDLVSTWKS